VSSHIRRILVTLLAGSLLVGALPSSPAAASTRAQDIERRLLNAERRERDLRILRLSAELSRVAKRHSRRMAADDRLFHNENLSDEVEMQWDVLGENVGVATESAKLRRTLVRLHDAFMESKPHRRNILRRSYRKVGIGIVRDDGKLWITLVFLG
jgi:uncharacterized protein YkwD